MPLDLKEIARLRAADTVILTPDNETNLTRAVWNELLDAAEAWELWREAACKDTSGIFISVGWEFDPTYGGQLSFGPLGTFGPYREPQAAVLAALKGTKT